MHTTKIPDISNSEQKLQWRRLERAKRRLFYAIIKFDLPLVNEVDHSVGTLRFEFLGDTLRQNGEKKARYDKA